MQLFQLERKPLTRFADWLFSRTEKMPAYDYRLWRVVSVVLWLVSCVVMGCAVLGMPTGFGAGIDVAVILVLNGLASVLAAYVIAFLLSILYIPVPRFHTGFLLYTAAVTYTVFQVADLGELEAAVVALAVTLAGELLGLGAALLLSRRLPAPAKAAAAALSAALVLTAWLAPSAAVPAWLAQAGITGRAGGDAPAADRADASADANADADTANGIGAPGQLTAADPAAPGPFRYRYYTYGSGHDRHRDAFAQDADFVTSSVDASAYIAKWNRWKQWFWGFDQRALPVNGRVWLPEGEGPFPLVLMVHGNHLMEQFSDGGYGYLGELLASRGIMAISVDENFLNYSVWSGIPKQDMKVRAWMLLKHLQMIREQDRTEGSVLQNKVDMNRIALLGHSRGGQAAAMAADASRWFAKDESLKDLLQEINIQSVVAIAPTDTTVDHTAARLHNTSYLTLQGAMDGDVNNFNGDEQYNRSSYSSGSGSFKSSLYIAEANHSQFNTAWGSMDNSMPDGILLSRKGMLKAQDQQHVAKVYVSAFLEHTLLDNTVYKSMFQDYRHALHWLPKATYVNRYEDGGIQALARYDEDRNKTTMLAGGQASASADPGMKWQEEEALNRDRKSKGTRGVVLEWKSAGSYTVELSERTKLQWHYSGLPGPQSITFSLANLYRNQNGYRSAPDVTIQLMSEKGSKFSIPLSSLMPVPNLRPTTFTRVPWLEQRMKDAKYKESSEPVFQTFRIPLYAFQFHEGTAQVVPIEHIQFQFQNGPGSIMLDDLGLYFDK
ncbi:alpha/beta hydrolase [Paenibacillus swuensis]|uniref:alpha/beta hydrolase n=1 Tax=Paenibacillus swuensis TaxID=1178515 RepID=UPI000837D6DB|nr:alpha/beta hydrolase [Paenibacillus swuensis]